MKKITYTNEMRNNDIQWKNENENTDEMLASYEQIMKEAKTLGFNGYYTVYTNQNEAIIELFDSKDEFEKYEEEGIPNELLFGHAKPLINYLNSVLNKIPYTDEMEEQDLLFSKGESDNEKMTSLLEEIISKFKDITCYFEPVFSVNQDGDVFVEIYGSKEEILFYKRTGTDVPYCFGTCKSLIDFIENNFLNPSGKLSEEQKLLLKEQPFRTFTSFHQWTEDSEDLPNSILGFSIFLFALSEKESVSEDEYLEGVFYDPTTDKVLAQWETEDGLVYRELS